MKKYLNYLLLSITVISFACNSTEDSSPDGEVYIKVTVNPALTNDQLVFGTELANKTMLNGTSEQTDKFLYPRNENLVVEVGFLQSDNNCYSITLETFFNNKQINQRNFSMNGFLVTGTPNCKDGYSQSVTIITPK